jgi:hypothetical protein
VGSAVIDWVADSGASNHTTLNAGNLTSVHPLTSTNPSSIIVGNESALLITSIGDSTLLSLFYLNTVLVTPDIIQNLYLFVILLLTIGVPWNLTRLAFLRRISLRRT